MYASEPILSNVANNNFDDPLPNSLKQEFDESVEQTILEISNYRKC